MTTFLLISLAQGVVVLPFLFVQITVPVFIVSLTFFPVHIFHAYWSLVVTPRLGPNLKVLGLMLLPVPLLLSPLLHIAFTVVFVTIIGPESMVFANFLENETGLTLKAILFGNVGHPFHYGLKYVQDYTDWYSKSIVDSLVDFRSGPDNGAFDIAIIQIFTGVLQSVIYVRFSSPRSPSSGVSRCPSSSSMRSTVTRSSRWSRVAAPVSL